MGEKGHPIARHISPDPAALADRLSACLARWKLISRGELSGGFRSSVFDCVAADGTEVVLKLPPTRYEAQSEAAALQIWSGTGATVELLEFDDQLGALLLQQLRPGTPLPPGDEEAAITAVADILAKLHGAPRGDFPFLRFEELYPAWEQRSLADLAYERRTRDEPLRAEAAFLRMELARDAATRLSETAGKQTLLHGDICAKNLLLHGTAYVAIDPIPRIGDPCSEVGFFAASYPLSVSGVFERAAALARLLDHEPVRAQRWAAIWAVHQGCQAWRPDQPALDALCASGELAELLA